MAASFTSAVMSIPRGALKHKSITGQIIDQQQLKLLIKTCSGLLTYFGS